MSPGLRSIDSTGASSMEEKDVDYYALLEVAADASTKEIRTAYRQKSLKVHPDRNPDNPQAAHLFHELSIAHDILSDAVKRAEFDKVYKARAARVERFKNLDNKRKNLASDLQAREDAYKKAKLEEQQNLRNERAELDRLREEGERMRKDKEEQREAAAKLEKQAEETRAREQANTTSSTLGEELGPLDTTIRLKWSRKQFPHLELEKDAIVALLPVKAEAIDSLVLSSKMLNNAKLKNGTAVVSFKTLTSAVKVMDSSGKGLLKDIETSWAAGQEPEAVKRAKQRHNSTHVEKESIKEEQPKASIPLPNLDEDRILEQMRARERERERLEDELRRQDAQDDANAA